MNTRKVGADGEDIAAEYLLSHGYEVITRNFGIGVGEIDLVAKCPEGTFVFVEVKFAKSTIYGDPAWKITPHKLRTIGRVAVQYLKEHNCESSPFRIDAITITPEKIEHFKNCM